VTSPLPAEVEISLGLEDAEDEAALRRAVARKLGIRETELPPVLLRKRSLDARRGRIRFQLLLELGTQADAPLGEPQPRQVSGSRPVVVVGDGPAGLFCAYQLARAGIATLVLDRGKQVQPRRRDLKLLNARGEVNPESNYCFGEGGAGTYSDGKLYTRSHKRGNVRDVLEVLALHGAPLSVLTEARPHIGSNLLPRVISAMRERLEGCGVQFRFDARVVGLGASGQGTERRVSAVRLADGEEIEARAVVLATGHSARDVLEMCAELGLSLEAKPFALGVRIEHPQALINRAQFGRYAGHSKLGAAAYRLASTVEERGVFSFCMCPGGWIVPAMTDAEHLVVNGMSLSKRDSDYANSGLVVGVEAQDWLALDLKGPLAGVEVQRRAERAARIAGGGENRAPATRVTDFLAGRSSSTLPSSSYLPGLTASDVGEVLDGTGLALASRLRAALKRFDRQLRGYVTEDAVLVGVESRTSAPVRVVRHPDSLEAMGLAGLYPCGEGAGYAGGIVSAAVDGVRVAQKLIENHRDAG
jgi:uncharacterized protein